MFVIQLLKIITSDLNSCFNLNHKKKMKQVISLLSVILITVSSFASVKPVKLVSGKGVMAFVRSSNSLSVNLQAAGKISISWAASVESTSTIYNIEKSVNGGEFKTVAILMGESNDTYFFRDDVKSVKGSIEYRVITLDKDTVVNSLTQSVVLL
jgi:hypothetical protein